jgi:hypothetical protein
MNASSRAWPAPAPWCGVEAWAASPRIATRPLKYEGAGEWSKRAQMVGDSSCCLEESDQISFEVSKHEFLDAHILPLGYYTQRFSRV